MAQRHRAAVHVDLVAVELEVADELLGHHREGLVDLEQVDIVEGQAGLFQNLARRRDRGVEHQGRAIAHIGHGHDAGASLQAMLGGVFWRCQQDRAGAVDHARRIAGMVDVGDLQVRMHLADQAAEGGALIVQGELGHGLEGGPQLAEAFHRRLRPGEFLVVEGEAAIFLVDRHQALSKAALADGDVGALLAGQGQFVDRLAADAFHRGDGVGADALVRLRMPRAQAQVAAVHELRGRGGVGGGRRVGHHLGAAGDDQVFHARHDHGRGQIDRGDPGATEAVEGNTAGLDVVAGVERGHAAEVAALLAALAGRAPDDVINLGGVQIVALGHGPEHRGGQLLRMDIGERAFANLADAARRAAGVDDQGFGHGGIPFRGDRRPVAFRVAIPIAPTRGLRNRALG